MNRISFGTDGWRAVISEDFTFENVRKVAQAVSDYVNSLKKLINNRSDELYRRKFKVMIGYDTRFLSEKYAELIACVLAGNGISVILSDRACPTPSVSFGIKNKKLIGGVMVTASHNPPQYNGIKYKGHFGGSAGKTATDYMESRIYTSRVKSADKDKALMKGLIRYEDIVTPHLKHIMKFVDMKRIRKSRLRVLVDSMSGSGARYLEYLLKDTPNKVTTINYARDPYFGNRPPEPNEAHLKNVSRLIKKVRYDVGLATDGDADRLAVILPSGKILTGHKVMTLLLLHLLEDRKFTGGVVQTICGTGLIDRISEAYSLKTYETPVGFKYISEVFGREDVLVGGEETGGVAFKGWIPERDALMSGMLILEMLSYRRKPLAKILESIDRKYGSYVYKRYDFIVDRNVKKELLARLAGSPFNEILGKKVVGVKSYDGYKFIRENGTWLMFRPSGTEPKMRIYSEGHTDKEALKLIEFGKKYIKDIS